MPSAFVETAFVTFTPSVSSFFTKASMPFTSREKRSMIVPLFDPGPAAAAGAGAGAGVGGGAGAPPAAGAAPAPGAPPPLPPRPPPPPPRPPPPEKVKSIEIHFSGGGSSALGTPPLRRELTVAPNSLTYQACPVG